MSIEKFDEFLKIAARKSKFDETNEWFKGAATYLSAIKEEVDEVTGEVEQNRTCYLEDELGDVLWNYLNAVLALEKETDITLESVFSRACTKYEERISAIENGGSWQEVKEKQKKALNHEFLDSKS